MPFLHRYLGNPVLSAVGRLFFKSPFGDFQCGLRAFRKTAYTRLALQTTSTEFASEMVVKATLFQLAEVPNQLAPRWPPAILGTCTPGAMAGGISGSCSLQSALAISLPRHRTDDDWRALARLCATPCES
jgi:hypothetical protein